MADRPAGWDQWVQSALGLDVAGVTPGAADNPGEAPNFSPVAVAKASLEWRSVCQASASEIDKLKKAIVAAYSNGDWDEDEIADTAEKIEQLDDALGSLDVELADSIDAFLNAANGAGKASAQQAVMHEIAEYESLVASDGLLADIDSNEFLSTGLQARALKAIAALKQGFAPV